MVATFFSKSGHVATIPLEEQRTVTANWYTTVCLPKVFEKLRERRPRTGLRGILLHHDNASAHTANATIQFLESTEAKLMTHPPLQSWLGSMRLFFVSIGEKSYAWKEIFQPWRSSCSVRKWAYGPWRKRVAGMLPKVVWKDEEVYTIWWRVLWKTPTVRLILLSVVFVCLKTFVVTYVYLLLYVWA